MLNLKIPFYEAGRIAEISEESKIYVVHRYDINGNKIKYYIHNKREKDFNDLLENYYDDLEGYLDFNRSKYEFAKKNVFKKIGYMKSFKKLKLIPGFLIVAPIIGILVNSGIGNIMICLALELLFVSSFVVLDQKSRFYESEEEKDHFVHMYVNYRKALEMYSKDKKKAIYPTKYSGVAKAFDRGQVKVDSKKKEKKNN